MYRTTSYLTQHILIRLQAGKWLVPHLHAAGFNFRPNKMIPQKKAFHTPISVPADLEGLHLLGGGHSGGGQVVGVHGQPLAQILVLPPQRPHLAQPLLLHTVPIQSNLSNQSCMDPNAKLGSNLALGIILYPISNRDDQEGQGSGIEKLSEKLDLGLYPELHFHNNTV